VNLPGLVGLAAGWRAMADARPLPHARRRADAVRDWLVRQPGVRVHGGEPVLPTISLTAVGATPVALAAALAERGVVARGGTQCAPRAHRALGTGDEGTLRLSFGPWGRDADVDEAIAALRDVLARR
jgi:selenocysteine lyase/cysteine desulfurase